MLLVPGHTPIAVLDTNVVLDWLVFRNSACTPLVQAIEAGRLRWIATAAMWDELNHVLSLGTLNAWTPHRDSIQGTWDRLALTLPTQTPGLIPPLRCTDPDDQKFIELALPQAHWLISRDRAVLKLSRRAAKLGLQIVAPDCWAHIAASSIDVPDRVDSF